MKTRTALFYSLWALILCCAPNAKAATFNAAGCSQQNVLDAVAPAANGDTILLPAGTCTWTDKITINKAITLQGAGIGQTVIIDARPASPDRTILVMDGVGDLALTRITGIEWRGDGLQAQVSDGMIVLSGCSVNQANFRIDHNKFFGLRNNSTRIYASIFGVYDHNIFDQSTSFGGGNNINMLTWSYDGVSCANYNTLGDSSWATPLTPGTVKAVYFEDNTVTGSFNSGQGPLGGITDCYGGARCVSRHNQLFHASIGGMHGTDSAQRTRGNRWYEAYENTATYHNTIPGAEYAIDSALWFRGGSGVMFNNKIYVDDRQYGFNYVARPLNLRSDDFNQRSFPPFYSTAHPGVPPDCDGTSPWDGNSGDASGAGYRCLDQPGAGTSADLHGSNPPTVMAMNQILEPIYVWGNTINNVPDNCGNQSWSCSGIGAVVGGRDIIYGPARPGYAPFTYPHPLVTGAAQTLAGDLSGDGAVNALDLQLEVNVILGSQTDAAIRARADLNSDGSANALDLQKLVNIILGV